MYDWAEFRHFFYLLKILEKGGFRLDALVVVHIDVILQPMP